MGRNDPTSSDTTARSASGFSISGFYCDTGRFRVAILRFLPGVEKSDVRNMKSRLQRSSQDGRVSEPWVGSEGRIFHRRDGEHAEGISG